MKTELTRGNIVGQLINLVYISSALVVAISGGRQIASLNGGISVQSAATTSQDPAQRWAKRYFNSHEWN